MGQFDTHDVFNQAPPLEGYDVFAADRALGEAVEREGAAWALPELGTLGTLAGSAGAQELGRLANEHGPALHTHDRYGHRVDVVEYHPAYHDLMRVSLAHGLHAGPWSDPRAGAVGTLYNLCNDPRLNHEVPVTAGVRAPECGTLLASFFAGKRTLSAPPAPAGRGHSD